MKKASLKRHELTDRELYDEATKAYLIKWPDADHSSDVISSVDEEYVNLRNNYQLLAKYNYRTKKFVDVDFHEIEE